MHLIAGLNLAAIYTGTRRGPPKTENKKGAESKEEKERTYKTKKKTREKKKAKEDNDLD